MIINVNGTDHAVSGEPIGYAEVVAMVYPGRSNPPLMSITYSWRGKGDLCRQGTLYPGKAPIEPAEGMNFSCYHTGNA